MVHFVFIQLKKGGYNWIIRTGKEPESKSPMVRLAGNPLCIHTAEKGGMGFAGRWLMTFRVTEHMYSFFFLSVLWCDVCSFVFVLPADKLITITTTYFF